MVWLSIFLVFMAGAMLPLQAGINSQLAKASGHAIWASGLSFVVGTLALLSIFFMMRLPWPGIIQLKEAPALAWTGGLMGAFFVTCMAFFAPKLGATTLLALIIAGQIVMSLLLDHFGAAGYIQQEITLPRIIGVLLIAAGVILVKKF